MKKGRRKLSIRGHGLSQPIAIICLVCVVATANQVNNLGFAANRRPVVVGLGLIATASPLLESAVAVAPTAFDYRSLDKIDASKRVVVGDLSASPAREAIERFRKDEAQAQEALVRLQANPLADITSLFGVNDGGKKDSILGGSKSGSLNGPLSGAAQAIRSRLKTIDELMDSATRADTERVGRLVLSAWYAVARDPDFPRLNPKSVSSYIEEQERKKEANQARLTTKIQNYLKTLQLLLKFVS